MKWFIVYLLTSVAILTVAIRVCQQEHNRSTYVGLTAMALLAVGILTLVIVGIVRLIKRRRRIDLHTT